MAKLTKSDVTHISELADLDLSEAEIEKYLPQLDRVIEYVGRLSEVDTKNTEPTSQTTGLSDVLRKDEVSSQDRLNQEEALSGTDKFHNGYFKVKAILSQRTDK